MGDQQTTTGPSSLSASAFGSLKVVVFSLTVEESRKRLDYGVAIDQVQEIGVVEQITRVPGAPSYVRGVMNLRGKIISVIDVKGKLGLESYQKNGADTLASGRILVGQVNSNPVGLLVDDVDNVLELSASEIETSPEIIAGSAPYIRGIAKRDGKLIVLIDLASFIGNQKESGLNQDQGGNKIA